MYLTKKTNLKMEKYETIFLTWNPIFHCNFSLQPFSLEILTSVYVGI